MPVNLQAAPEALESQGIEHQGNGGAADQIGRHDLDQHRQPADTPASSAHRQDWVSDQRYRQKMYRMNHITIKGSGWKARLACTPKGRIR